MNTAEFILPNLTDDQKNFIETNFPNSYMFTDRNGELVICTGVTAGRKEITNSSER